MPVTEIATLFGFSHPYLYEMWKRFEAEGTIAFIKKNWGSAPRKVTTEVEAAIIRAKAIDPEKKDEVLAQEFGVNRATVYRLLKEHGIQDLHRSVKR
ncbi:MAG: hypothetical protein AAF485_01365 [Chloroflexota bacterium]